MDRVKAPHEILPVLALYAQRLPAPSARGGGGEEEEEEDLFVFDDTVEAHAASYYMEILSNRLAPTFITCKSIALYVQARTTTTCV